MVPSLMFRAQNLVNVPSPSLPIIRPVVEMRWEFGTVESKDGNFHNYARMDDGQTWRPDAVHGGNH